MKPIGNPWAYFFDSRRFALWHRKALPANSKAIDIDLNGYCIRCYRPIYVIEATSAVGHKPSTVLEGMARAAGCRAFVARIDPSHAPPDEFPWSVAANAMQEFVVEKIELTQVYPTKVEIGWLPSAAAAALLDGVRQQHESACVPWLAKVVDA